MHRALLAAPLLLNFATSADMKNETFGPLGEVFIDLTRSLLAATPSERPASFDAWLGGCLACHATMCGGPVPSIEAMRLSSRQSLPHKRIAEGNSTACIKAELLP